MKNKYLGILAAILVLVAFAVGVWNMPGLSTEPVHGFVMGPFEAAELELKKLSGISDATPCEGWYGCKRFDVYMLNYLNKPTIYANVVIVGIISFPGNSLLVILHYQDKYYIPFSSISKNKGKIMINYAIYPILFILYVIAMLGLEITREL